MTLQTCNDLYRSYLRKREDHHLREGGYKRDESVRNLQRMRATVDAIGARVKAKQRFEPNEILGCCLAEERGWWLKSLPGDICQELGFNLIPALRLTVDDPAQLDRAALALVDRAEAARLWLVRGGVGREYEAMKGEGSELRRLLEAALDIAGQ